MTTNDRQPSKTFCTLPWMHLAVMPEGTARVCCVADKPVEVNGAPASVQTHDLEAIWNSPHMRRVRLRMVEGQHVADCATCYIAEKQGGFSQRVEANRRWAEQLGDHFLDRVHEASRQDHVIAESPLSYQLIPGNNCNLKCRMCYPAYSSRIERDDVHRAWTPGLPYTAGDNRPLGRLTWLRRLFRRGRRLLGLLSGRNDDPSRKTTPVAEGKQQLLRVRLRGDASQPVADPQKRGAAVEKIELNLVGTAQPRLQSTVGQRLPNGPWYRDDAWIREVLLQNVDRLEGLYFTGGEPMIEKQVEKILDYLIKRKAAGNIVLEFNTNCTVIRDEMMAKLAQFKKVVMALSLDAYGPYHEYIRYPSKWDVVRRNVEKLVAASSERLYVLAGPVVQVYNALNLAEAFEFFDALRIPYGVRFASEPWFLAVDILPASVKQAAAARLKAYADRCPGERRNVVLSAAEQIVKTQDRCNQEALRTLMLFTNDLDAGRGQNFRQVHAELLDLLEAEGFRWTNELLHAA
jgi:pyruvate-formate lyase-activating enzyme